MSSSDIAIRVEGVSMCFEIFDTPRDQLKQFVLPRVQRLVGVNPRTYYREFWALKDVSILIKKGESVGIVGRNGSGKSTLLQAITGTLSSTRGTIATQGRVAALLELGSGFNPEFTGRENVFLNSAILGLSQEEISDRYADIAAFADIGTFIDQPVKTYSSGMALRLAFAVAINVNPDILIIDEALSVGDELFQRKCFSRIESIRQNGATILFVSHSSTAVIELCDRAVLMDAGEKLASGHPKQIIGRYQKLLYAPADRREFIRNQIRLANDEVASVLGVSPETQQGRVTGSEEIQVQEESFDPGLMPSSTIMYESRGACIKSPEVTTLTGQKVNNLVQGRSYRYKYKVLFTRSASRVRFGMLIKTTSGVELGGGISASESESGLDYVERDSIYDVEFGFRCALNPGVYFLNAGVVGYIDETEAYLHRSLDCACIKVMASSNEFSNGIINFDVAPEIIKSE